MKLRALLLLGLVGCPLPMPHPTPPEGPPEPFPRPPIEGASLAHHPALKVALRAPARVPYVAEALGVGGQSVSLRVTNTGGQSVPVGGLRVSFAATRDGVPFPCAEHVGGSVRSREPASLAPGQSFVFERDLDCTMSLPGRYSVTVYAALPGDAKGERGDVAGAFSLHVVEEGIGGPRPYPSRPGLFVAMTGGRMTHPLPEEAWARGDYHVVVSVMNGASHAIAVGPARLAFVTYKKGSPLPCSGQAESIPFPEQLAPGAMHVAQAPVACAPSEEGRYEIVGRVALGEGEEIEIGRVGLKVSSDPFLFSPERSPSWSDRPAGAWVK